MDKVILYYNFFPIESPEDFCLLHRQKCSQLGLTGRVLIAPEGINGTLAGTSESIDRYKDYLQGLSGFEDTEFKEDLAKDIPFTKLIVKTRPEIVTLKAGDPIDVKQSTGHLEPSEWKALLESDEDFVLLDVRNNYETKIGRFQGALTPDVENFYDFPEWLQEANLQKDKKILMYCTGGIRCEKFSVFMKSQGYQDVLQLHGGIINYAQKEGGKHFKGKCFVFDDRLAVPVNKDDNDPITQCEITGVPCDTYLNCADPDCNKLFICSEEGAKKMEGCCSEKCLNSSRKRPFNPENIYAPFRKWYHYFKKKPKVTVVSR